MSLIAQPFVIYFDSMIQDYDNALPDIIKQPQPETYEGGEFEERKVATHLWRHTNASKKA